MGNFNKFFSVTYLCSSASSMGALDLSIDSNNFISKSKYNFNKKFNGKFKNNLYYYLGCNNFLLGDFSYLKKMIVHNISIYQHSHVDFYYNFVDFFLPSYSYAESNNNSYINCFGILKLNRQILFPPTNFIKDNLEIISIISNIFSIYIVNNLTFMFPYNSLVFSNILEIFSFNDFKLNYKLNSNLLEKSLRKLYIFSKNNKNFDKEKFLINFDRVNQLFLTFKKYMINFKFDLIYFLGTKLEFFWFFDAFWSEKL